MVGNTSKQQAICFPFEGFLWVNGRWSYLLKSLGMLVLSCFWTSNRKMSSDLALIRCWRVLDGKSSQVTQARLTLLGGRGVIGIYWRDLCQWLQHRLKRRPPCVQRQVCQGLLVYSVWNLWYRNSDWASSRRKDLRQEAGTTDFFYIRWGRQERPLGHL